MDTNLFWRLRGTYAARRATLASAEREFLEAAIMTIIDAAMHLNEQGGDLAKIVDTTNAKLDELWLLLASIKI